MKFRDELPEDKDKTSMPAVTTEGFESNSSNLSHGNTKSKKLKIRIGKQYDRNFRGEKCLYTEAGGIIGSLASRKYYEKKVLNAKSPGPVYNPKKGATSTAPPVNHVEIV